MRLCSRQHGFTLVELVTTLIIVGILAAVTLPRFFDNDAFRERGYTDEVASALRYAQRIAVASQCRVRVTVNAANYSAMQQAACANAGAWNVPVRRLDGNNLTGVAPQGIVLAPATTTITFDANGDVAANATLTVGTIFTINVDTANDMVTVQP